VRIDRLGKLFVTILFVILFALCSGFVPAQAAESTFTLKLTNFLPNQHYISIAIDQWAKEVEKETQGRVKVKIFHSATLAAPVQQYDAVVKGIADVGNHVLGYTVNRFPLTEVVDLPLGIPSGIVATRMMNDYLRKLKPKEFDDVKVLWLHGPGPGFLCTRNRPVWGTADLKDLRIRTYGGNARFMQALGAVPVGMPMTEVYEALAGGAVDGLLSGIEALESFRTMDHIRYITQNRWTSYTVCMLMAMNKKVWNSLPPDIQKAIDDLSRNEEERFGKVWDNADLAAESFLDRRSVRHLSLTKEEEQRWVAKGAQPVFDDYVKRMKERNLPGNEALGVVLDYLKPYKR
jgi:TRAP-type transport system periplasmic protein